MKIKIGTRTSLMAMAQARTVSKLLKEIDPSLDIELVGIVPIGDQDKTTPLPQMNAIGVFSKEIDDYLLDGRIDCAVHSLKDLGTIRPQGVVRAALLKRDDPHDIILFHPDIRERLRNKKEITIGTSAPRRAELLPEFLRKALPDAPQNLPVHLKSIRGNANTRLSKLFRAEENLDGIVLALAGLERLYNDEHSQGEIAELLKNTLRMIVPVTVCPPAPGQGTVCIETRDDRADILNLFARLNHAPTQKAVEQEYSILTENGGGCHQRFGVLSLQFPNIQGNVLLVRGKNKDGVDITDCVWDAPPKSNKNKIWDGTKFTTQIFDSQKLAHAPITAPAAFIAHSNAVPENFEGARHLWVSGTKSWFKLAQKGLWVEGCADGFGFDFIFSTLNLPVLNLPSLEAWDILSHDVARIHWDQGNFIPTYTHAPLPLSVDMLETLKNSDVFWWPSASLFKNLKTHLPKGDIIHCCGAGKTAEILMAEGLTPLYVFPTIDEFYRWNDDTNCK